MSLRIVVIGVWLVGCAGGTQAPKDLDPVPSSPAAVAPSASAAPERVCCESFGYGARMVECCTRAVWAKANECQVPSGFVGGGKRVVDDAKCQAN